VPCKRSTVATDLLVTRECPTHDGKHIAFVNNYAHLWQIRSSHLHNYWVISAPSAHRDVRFFTSYK